MQAKTKLILIADDYDHAAMLLADLLAHATEFDAVATKDGREALEQAALRRPDVALLDIDMPEIDGIETARRLRATFGESRPLLIAMTGRAPDEAKLSGMFDHVLAKPFDIAMLLSLLGQG